ncbi:MAG: DUF1294 domain-containing protein [Lachnospiraceae bacterium]|nr:DUF1294 domain-containing protein [Lachnospiraceae bacterium]
MNLSNLYYYFIAINTLGFILVLLNPHSSARIKGGQKDLVPRIVCLLGGASGILIAILFFDRKTTKENIMTRVLVCCFLVIQVIVFLMVKGFRQEKITFAFWEFFKKSRALTLYLLTINIVTLIAFGLDKRNAKKGQQRIRITTLLGLSYAGGAIGGLIAMYALRHKTKKKYFTVGLPLMVIMQILVIFYIMNIGIIAV